MLPPPTFYCKFQAGGGHKSDSLVWDPEEGKRAHWSEKMVKVQSDPTPLVLHPENIVQLPNKQQFFKFEPETYALIQYILSIRVSSVAKIVSYGKGKPPGAVLKANPALALEAGQTLLYDRVVDKILHVLSLKNQPNTHAGTLEDPWPCPILPPNLILLSQNYRQCLAGELHVSQLTHNLPVVRIQRVSAASTKRPLDTNPELLSDILLAVGMRSYIHHILCTL